MSEPRHPATPHNLAAACDGKVGFASYAIAESVIRRKRARRKHKTARIAYRCRYCNRWHIGGRPE